jgi:hypothetical protein
LKNIVRDVINRVYIKKDHDYFKHKANSVLELPEKLYQISKNNTKVVGGKDGSGEVSVDWYIHFPKVIKGEFSALFTTVLKISKIIPIFYIQHEFAVENRDEKKIEPKLEGFSGQPYSIAQFDMHNSLVECLGNLDYVELSYSEMNEVISGISIPQETRIFGEQMTVETALFRDVYDLCSAEEA